MVQPGGCCTRPACARPDALNKMPISHQKPMRRVLHPFHCIWSSMFENAALSLSAFLISSPLT